MLSILSSRNRLKLNKNFMRILDASYYYYEYIMNQEIKESDTIGTLTKPITAYMGFDFDEKVLSVRLSDYRNDILHAVTVDDITTDRLINSLKSKYILMSYNSGHNMMDASCKHLIWKLDISTDYASDNNCGKVIQLNENNECIEIVRDKGDGMNIIRTSYSKLNPMSNYDIAVKGINDFDLDRVSKNVYAKADIDGKYSVEICADGRIKLSKDKNSCIFIIDDDTFANAMTKNSLSTYIGDECVYMHMLGNDQSITLTLPYESYPNNAWDKLLGNVNMHYTYSASTEFRELLSHNSFDGYLGMLQREDPEQSNSVYTNGHRVFTHNDIYMARNELTRVVKSYHFDKDKCSGIPCESSVYEATIEHVIMPNGGLVINSFTGTTNTAIKINNRQYTIIRNVGDDSNYLAWTDDGSAWAVIIPLPDNIIKIETTLCNEYYIVFSDIGGYLWAYSIDLSKNTIA